MTSNLTRSGEALSDLADSGLRCTDCGRYFKTADDAAGHLDKRPRMDGIHFCRGRVVPIVPADTDQGAHRG